MDCQTFGEQIKSLHSKETEARLGIRLQQHYDACRKCRDRYADIFSRLTAVRIIPQPSKARGSDPTEAEAPDQLTDPVEFKDAPISFTLHLMAGKKRSRWSNRKWMCRCPKADDWW